MHAANHGMFQTPGKYAGKSHGKSAEVDRGTGFVWVAVPQKHAQPLPHGLELSLAPERCHERSTQLHQSIHQSGHRQGPSQQQFSPHSPLVPPS